MAVVTISRQFGAGGQTLGEKLCERFGFKLVDASMIDELARKDHLLPNWLTAVEQEASNTLLNILGSTLSRGGLFYRKQGRPGQSQERRKYIDFLDRTFTPMANQGGYVIVGRGAQFVLKDHPKALHLLLVAEYENRVSFLMEHYSMTRPEAEKTIRAREKLRGAVASSIFHAEIDDPSLYHMCLNSSLMTFDWVVDNTLELVARYLDLEDQCDQPEPSA